MACVLYSGTRNASSWAFRAWLALKEGGIEFEEQVVDIRRPQRYANLNRIGEISPAASVPVLVTDGAVIFDSLAIMEYANDLAGGALLPKNLRERAAARSFMAWQHAGMSGLCSRLSFESAFYTDKREMTPGEKHEAARIHDACERQLSASNGPYLFGDLSLADLALVPSVMRLAAHTDDMGRWPRVRAWIDILMSRESVREWLTAAEAETPIWYANYYP